MNKQIKLVNDFHKKFHVPVLDKPSLIPPDRSGLRFVLMEEEVREYKEGTQREDLENISQGLESLSELLEALFDVSRLDADNNVAINKQSCW